MPTTVTPITPDNLHQQAMLVGISFKYCRQSWQSESDAREVEKKNNSERGVSKVSNFYFKHIVAGKEVDALADLRSYNGFWKRELYSLARYPWAPGLNILPVVFIEQCLALDAKRKAGFIPVKDAFASQFGTYTDWKNSAPTRMGHLYNEKDFPSLEEVQNDIGYEFTMLPMAEADQWKRITIMDPQLAVTMTQKSNEQAQEKLAGIQAQIWKDLIEPVQKIVTTLTKDKARIFDSLLTNLTDILGLAPAFNVHGDQNMSAFIEEAKATLSTITADDLRNDPAFRKQAVKNANNLLAKFGSYAERKFA